MAEFPQSKTVFSSGEDISPTTCYLEQNSKIFLVSPLLFCRLLRFYCFFFRIFTRRWRRSTVYSTCQWQNILLRVAFLLSISRAAPRQVWPVDRFITSMIPWLRRSQIAARLSRTHREKSFRRLSATAFDNKFRTNVVTIFFISTSSKWHRWTISATSARHCQRPGSLVHDSRLLNHSAPPKIEIYAATHRAGVVTIELNSDWRSENFQLLFSFMALKIPFLKALRDLIPVFKRFSFPHYSALGFRSTEAENNFKIPNSRSAMIASQTINLWFTPDCSTCGVYERVLFTSYDRTQFSKNVSCFFRLFCEKRSKHFAKPRTAQHFHTFSSISAKNIPFRLNLQFLCEVFFWKKKTFFCENSEQ